MATKVKGEAIKEGSIPLSALSKEIKDKIENAGGGADWNAQKSEAGYIENKTHSAEFGRIEYDQENNKYKYETAVPVDKLLLLWRDKYFTVHKNIPLTIDVNEGEDTFIVNYNGITLFITDSYGYLKHEYKYMSVSETYIPLTEAFIPDTVLTTTPQKLSYTDKNQALTNLGIDPVVWKYLCNPCIIKYGEKVPEELIGEYSDDVGSSGGYYLKYPNLAMYKIIFTDNRIDLEYGEASVIITPSGISEYGVELTDIHISKDYGVYTGDAHINKNKNWDSM